MTDEQPRSNVGKEGKKGPQVQLRIQAASDCRDAKVKLGVPFSYFGRFGHPPATPFRGWVVWAHVSELLPGWCWSAVCSSSLQRPVHGCMCPALGQP